MFRGTTTRTLLTFLGMTLLAFQLLVPAGTFASAHTCGQARAKAETGIIPSVQPLRDGAEKARTPGRPDEPVGLPQVRDRNRCPASCCSQERALMSNRAAGADPSEPPDGSRPHTTPRASRAHTPAALQVFRC
ncbi:hypothetical protein CFC35_09105 [Streptomyces sp. FBKL.4005]|uniref:Secreted protein n=1 Tax=Streptomyces bangladeshensis TaxID=295352 RepID=A0ABN3BHU1_9ACTN|nr:hypothetical protein [Streptomyces sp. FBKL.4005]OYP14658.1 hypothetical protein CFC35_09105 [Streptomyces sp. FBKL.4005]BCM70210.1 hypothetical protein EASAB2608_05544 [Streptomyces sp. EAS-AB2608]CUW31915.1 hypothetical protein TUE45_06664 [Streptomyces reticuli]